MSKFFMRTKFPKISAHEFTFYRRKQFACELHNSSYKLKGCTEILTITGLVNNTNLGFKIFKS